MKGCFKFARRAATLVGASSLLAVLLVSAPHAQSAPTRPSFDGRWTEDFTSVLQVTPNPSQPLVRPPLPGPGFGHGFVCTQDAAAVIVENNDGPSVGRMTINLDGSESQDTINGIQVVSRAKWIGTALSIETRGARVDWNAAGRITRSMQMADNRTLLLTTTAMGGTSATSYRRSN